MDDLTFTNFLSDQQIKLLLADQNKLDARSREGSDGIDTHRWGYFQPRNGQGSILEFKTGCNEYSVIIDERIGGPIVIPGNSELHDHIKLDGAGGASIRTSADGIWHCLSDKYVAQFGRLKYMYHDTLHAKRQPDGAFVEYEHLTGSKVFRGAFGIVIKVANRATQRHFALKIVKATKRIRGMPEMATFEISALKALDHPNVCKLEDIFLGSDNSLHIVMEYAPDGNLLERLVSPVEFSHSNLSPQELVGSTAYQLCTALEFIHSKGLIHRDLKPDNVLITSEVPWVVKIADFGCAAQAMIKKVRPTSICGVSEYMAPEMAKGEGYGNGVDAYGLGVIVHKMILLISRNTSLFEFDGQQMSLTTFEFINERKNMWKLLDDIHTVNEQALELVEGLLQENPANRLSMTLALNNTWLLEVNERITASWKKTVSTRFSTEECDSPTTETDTSRVITPLPQHQESSVDLHADISSPLATVTAVMEEPLPTPLSIPIKETGKKGRPKSTSRALPSRWSLRLQNRRDLEATPKKGVRKHSKPPPVQDALLQRSPRLIKGARKYATPY